MRTIRHRRTTPRTARALTTVLTAALVFLGLAGTAPAAEAQAATEKSRVVLSGRVDVAADETVRDVVVMHGSVTVDGTVDGSVIVLDGPVAIRGAVMRDVIVLNGAVVVADGARIGHDLVTPRAPQVATGATIDGAVRRVRTDWGLRGLGVSVFWSWLAISASTLALGLLLVVLAPRAADAAGRSDTAARVSRIALLPYLDSYGAFDSVVGPSSGLMVRRPAVPAHPDAGCSVRRDRTTYWRRHET